METKGGEGMERVLRTESKNQIRLVEPSVNEGEDTVINGVTVLRRSARRVVKENRLTLTEGAWNKVLGIKEEIPGGEEHINSIAHLCDLLAHDSLAIDVLLGRRIVIDD